MFAEEWELLRKYQDNNAEGHIALTVGNRVKKEIQGTRGLVRCLRLADPLFEARRARKAELKKCLKEISDPEINDLLNKFYLINQEAQQFLAKDFIYQVQEADIDLTTYPVTREIINLVEDECLPLRFRLQLTSTLLEHVEVSLGASRKSLAGQAAQDVFEAILIKAGLREHEHYTRQFKTDEGSDADFVIPAVSTGENNKIDIMIAVQISSNDRAKLVKGELLPGVIPYLATFNGFDASTKDHQDLGDPIVKGMIQSRFRIVCSELGRVREIERIERKLQSDDSDQTRQRLDFFKKNVVSYKELSESLTRYLSERS